MAAVEPAVGIALLLAAASAHAGPARLAAALALRLVGCTVCPGQQDRAARWQRGLQLAPPLGMAPWAPVFSEDPIGC